MGTLRNEYVKCGKKTCGKCPHGPYWYEYFRTKLGPKAWRSWKRYLGKKDPRTDVPEDADEAIWEHDAGHVTLAYRIIGAKPGMTRQEAKRAYVVAKMRLDPCRPADVLKLQRVEHAWALIRRANSWQ